jgi:hypothetical protein
MAETTDVLLKLVQEQWTQARQSEEQRATMTNFLLVLAAAILGFVVDKGLTRELWPLTGLLALLGIFGAVASSKYYERFRFHMEISYRLEERLEQLHLDLNYKALFHSVDLEQRSKFPIMFPLRLNKLWLCLHLSIALIGLISTTAVLWP